jgi:CPA2 family monovalent cation:H+ antiporter-2
VSQPGLALIALAIVLLCNPATAMAVLLVMRYPWRVVLTVATALGQIGEFSFILMTLARDLGIMPAAAVNTVVAVAIVSITVNPAALHALPALEGWLSRVTGVWRRTAIGDELPETRPASSLDPRERAVVVGYGPTGRTVTRLLRDNGIAPTIIELNMDTVRRLWRDGMSAVYGDARDRDTLVSAGVRHADTLIVSGADSGTPETIRSARELNPNVRVVARGAYLRDVPALREAGAEEVFSGEGEVALAMTEAVLRRLGATAEQIDRERARVHEELTSV